VETINVIRQTQIAAKQWESFRAIYLDSFPSYERAEFASLTASIVSGARWLFTATRDDDLIGFAIIVPFVVRDVHLLEYLAVSRAARSGGIGGALLDGAVAAIRNSQFAIHNSQSAIGLILEVEPDDEGAADERALRARRIAFYARHGAQSVDAPNYRVPLADRAGTMRMKLLWLPVVANAAAPRGEKLRECVAGILEKSYEVCNGTLLQEIFA
jgi:GNAT superfamily N-acetyltransferase